MNADIPTETLTDEVSASQGIYAGDYVDLTATPLKSQFECLAFADPSEMLYVFDEHLRTGTVNLHPWQIDLLESLASAKPTSQHPHKFCLCAANGSGKDAYIAAPFAVWFILCKIQSRVIITSSSGTQLTGQTEPAIRNLCEKINTYFGEEIFRIRQRYIKCRLSGSEIRMFATDEAGKAEGYHPIVPNAEMAILVNEGKSVTEEIHGALRRCTGFNYWLEYSTPGEPVGSFYKFFTTWKHTKRVTSYDCPHLSDEEREEDKRDLGEHSALFRSKHLALFTSIGGQVIITSELLEKLKTHKVQPITLRDSIGLDLAAGGDENSCTRTVGNKVKSRFDFRETDTTITADKIEQWFISQGIDKSFDHIYADDGGVGHAIIDMLVRKGWKINRIMNQWAAYNKKQFGNRGAENWYRTKRIFEELLFDISNLDEKTLNQLCTRKYKQGLTGARIFLEAKKEAIANGRPSPDRADSLILSLTGLTVDDFLNAKIEQETVKIKGNPKERQLTADELPDYYANEVMYGPFKDKKVSNSRVYCNSLAQAMRN